MINLEKVFKNPVSLIKVSYNEDNYLQIPRMFSGGPVIFSVMDEDSECENYNILKESEEKFNFVTPKEIKEMMIKSIIENKDEVDFCSIIIVNDIHNSTLGKMTVINLWNLIYKISKRRPYLVITTYSSYIPSLTFNLNTSSIQDVSVKNKMELDYYSSNFSPYSDKISKSLFDVIIKKNKERELKDSSIWVVFYCGKEDLAKSLYDEIGVTVNIYTSKSIRNLGNFFTEDKRNIIIVEENYLPPGIINNIEMVFDSMISKSGDQIVYSSKQISEIRSSYCGSGHSFRLCTEIYFEELPKISFRDYENMCLDKHYIEMIKNKIDVKKFFCNIVSSHKLIHDLKSLEIRGAFIGETVTPIGDFISQLPLRTENCDLLYRWANDKKAIFPCIVACVLSEIIQPLYKEKNPKIFHEYLRKINSILMKESSLDQTNMGEVSRIEKIDLSLLEEIFSKIKEIVTILRKKYKFQVGVYNTDNLINALVPYYEKAYYNETFRLIDKKNGLYKNGDQIYKIDKMMFGYDFKFYPIKIFCFKKERINTYKESYQQGRNFIYYFV